MNELMRDRISALIDEELAPSEHAAVVDQLCASEHLRSTWSRYHLIGDALRRELPDDRAFSIASRVREQLQEEPTVLVPRSPMRRMPRWVKPMAGTAIAASVAAAAILLVPAVPNLPDAATTAEIAGTDELPTTVRHADADGTRWDLGKPALESKLNTYLVNHRNYAPVANLNGMISYASFAGYDSRR